MSGAAQATATATQLATLWGDDWLADLSLEIEREREKRLATVRARLAILGWALVDEPFPPTVNKWWRAFRPDGASAGIVPTLAWAESLAHQIEIGAAARSGGHA